MAQFNGRFYNRVDYSDLLKAIHLENMENNLNNVVEELVEAVTSEDSLKRSRILSNEKVKYIYQRNFPVIHDKSCIEVKQIPDSEIEYCIDYPANFKSCKICRKKAYIRQGAEDISEYKKYAELFHNMNVDIKLIYHMYIECGIHTTAGINLITVKYGDETWKIKFVNSTGEIELLHNNYRKYSDGTRTIGGGYHKQKLYGGNSIINAINYIKGYSWESHREKIVMEQHKTENSPNEYTDESFSKMSNVTKASIHPKHILKNMIGRVVCLIRRI